MKEKRSTYIRKRSLYRRIKSKTKEQLAREKEEQTHGRLYKITACVWIFIAGFFAYQSSNTVYGLISFIFLFAGFIVLFENLFYTLHLARNKKGEILKTKTMLWILAGKEMFFSYILILMSLIIVLFILKLLPFEISEKSNFNILITAPFLIAFLIYCIYTKFEIDSKIYKKTAKKDKKKLERFEKEKHHVFFLNITDIIAIVATVLLLSNSTFSLVNPTQAGSVDDLLYTFEFKVLLFAMANYVPAIYLRIPK